MAISIPAKIRKILLVQMLQTVSLHYHLRPLTLEETIVHRYHHNLLEQVYHHPMVSRIDPFLPHLRFRLVFLASAELVRSPPIIEC